jgi:pimeloyl-ACP methyl ester carboxylesterase
MEHSPALYIQRSQMHSFDIPYRQHRIHCRSAGSGAGLLICLHGFGESGSSFEPLSPVAGQGYTLVCPDLPLHGETRWNARQFTPAQLADILHLIAEKFGRENFMLLGYSMGARLALAVFQQHPERIRGLILLAPDGLRENWWQRISTHTTAGNRLLGYFIHRPGIFFAAVRIGKFLGLVHRGISRFVLVSMDTAEKRRLVYDTWTCMKDMTAAPVVARRLLDLYQVPLLLVFGKYDRLVPASVADHYFRHQNRAEVITVEKGHMLITEDFSPVLNEWLEKWTGR